MLSELLLGGKVTQMIGFCQERFWEIVWTVSNKIDWAMSYFVCSQQDDIMLDIPTHSPPTPPKKEEEENNKASVYS